MTIEIKAPAFPESVADGEVAVWHKQEGDAVQRDELLVEIETDKVVMEVVAPESGHLSRIVAETGDTIISEALLAELTPGEVSVNTELSNDAKPSIAQEETPAMGPAARQLVEEHKLDPAAINGSGKGGRINKDDVLAHLASVSAVQEPKGAAASIPEPLAPHLREQEAFISEALGE